MAAVWVFVAVGIGLLAASLRMWLEFTQRARQLNNETAHARSLIDNHKEALAMVQGKIGDLKSETEELLKERTDVEAEVQEKRSALTALEERLERSRPARFRVDKSSDDGEELF